MIRLSGKSLRSVRRHAVRTYRDEACGLLLGNVAGLHKTVLATVPVENRAVNTTRDRYLVSATDYTMVEKLAERIGLSVVGIYHSHPDHPAIPSERDRVQALPFFSYVITSVVAAETRQTRSFVLSDDRKRFAEESIVLSEADSERERGELTCP